MATTSELVIAAALAAGVGAAGWVAKTVFMRREERRTSETAVRSLARLLLEELTINWKALDAGASALIVLPEVTNTVFVDKRVECADRFSDDVWQVVLAAYKAIDDARAASSPENPGLLADTPIPFEFARDACGRAISALGGRVPASAEEEMQEALDQLDRSTLTYYNDAAPQMEEALRLGREAIDKLERELAPELKTFSESIRQTLEAGTPIQEVSRSVRASFPADTPPESLAAIDELILSLARQVRLEARHRPGPPSSN